MSSRDYHKEIEQLPTSFVANLVVRVAARAKENWRVGNDERVLAVTHKNQVELTPALLDFHLKLWTALGNALSSGNFGEVAHMVEDEGRALANMHVQLQVVMDNTSACLNRWVNLLLVEAEHDPTTLLHPRAFQALVRRVNQLQSRIMISMVSGYNDQMESGEPWLYRPGEPNVLRDGADHSINNVETFFEQLTAITSEYSINRYRAGMPIFNDNHDLQRSRFYFVRSGTVQIQEYLPDGRALTLTILGQGDVFARFAGSARNKQANYFKDFQAETMRETELLWVDEGALQRAMERSPVLAASIIKSFSTQLASVQQLIQGLLGRDVSVRLAHLLLKLADEFGTPNGTNGTFIDYPLSHQRLADMMGSNRVTVTRQLSELQKQGILEIQRRSIILYNRRLLEATGA